MRNQSKQHEGDPERREADPDGANRAPAAVGAGRVGGEAERWRSRGEEQGEHPGFAHERRCQERSLREFS